MRNNKKVLEKIEKLDQLSQMSGDEADETFMVALDEVAKVVLKSVENAINPLQEEELVFLVPALKVFAESLEDFFNEEGKIFAESTYNIMKMIVNGVKKEEV